MTEHHDEEDDPYLEDVLDDAIGPLAGLLPPLEQGWLREALRDAVKDDPTLAELYAAARPRVIPQRSGEEDAHPEAAARDAKAPVVAAKRKGGAA